MSKTRVEIDSDLKDLIPQFIENRKKDIDSLQSLVATHDLTAIAALAHKIKGAAAGYGFSDLSSIAAEIEKEAKNNNDASLQKLAQNMRTHFENIEIHFVSM
ncbi:MAG: Hpt domain-containing protein [Bacillota bacterium]